MQASDLLREGKIDEALARLQDGVRASPADPKLRVFLFQLLCVLGKWDRAMTQLNVAAEMDPKTLLMAQVCRPALNCEALRTQIFQGKRQPLVLGEPEEWVGWLIQAAMLIGSGRYADAGPLREKALEAAPAISGTINGQPFEWIADADGRLGPMLEAIIDGRYYWVPLTKVRTISIDVPTDLRDVVWIPAQIVWTNGGNAVALLPVRYAGSEASADPAIRLARRTDWQEPAPGLLIGLGQRMLATDLEEHPILQVRQIELNNPMAPGVAPDAGAGAAAGGPANG